MIVRLDVKEITAALGRAAIDKMDGSGNFEVTLKGIEMHKDTDGIAQKVFVDVEIRRK